MRDGSGPRWGNLLGLKPNLGYCRIAVPPEIVGWACFLIRHAATSALALKLLITAATATTVRQDQD